MQQVELTVVRPSGKTEVIIHPTLKFITSDQFKQIQEGTKAANRGDAVSYRNLRDGVEIKPATMADIKANKGKYELGLKESMVNKSTKAIYEMAAGGE